MRQLPFSTRLETLFIHAVIKVYVFENKQMRAKDQNHTRAWSPSPLSRHCSLLEEKQTPTIFEYILMSSSSQSPFHS